MNNIMKLHFYAWWSFWLTMLIWDLTFYKVHILGLVIGTLIEFGIYFYNNYISNEYRVRDYRDSIGTIAACLIGSLFTIFV